jgi:chromosome segregation ATPase
MQLDLCSEDLDRYVLSTQQLIEENKNLVKHLYQKTTDAKRMAESLTLNESEEILDLKHQIELYREENHHLIAHLQDSRRKESEYHGQINNLKEQIKNASALDEKLNFDFETSKAREEELAKTLAIL